MGRYQLCVGSNCPVGSKAWSRPVRLVDMVDELVEVIQPLLGNLKGARRSLRWPANSRLARRSPRTSSSKPVTVSLDVPGTTICGRLAPRTMRAASQGAARSVGGSKIVWDEEGHHVRTARRALGR